MTGTREQPQFDIPTIDMLKANAIKRIKEVERTGQLSHSGGMVAFPEEGGVALGFIAHYASPPIRKRQINGE